MEVLLVALVAELLVVIMVALLMTLAMAGATSGTAPCGNFWSGWLGPYVLSGVTLHMTSTFTRMVGSGTSHTDQLPLAAGASSLPKILPTLT